MNYSLTGIRAFECAARHKSFTKASEELCLTQGAISKQVSSLESRLSFALFHRLPRKLVLTREGEVLFNSVSPALLSIKTAIEEINVRSLPTQQVVLSAPESFSLKWLVPRLGTFNFSHPEIELLIEAENKYVDLSKKEVDLLIRYGDGNYPGFYTKYLMDEYLVPVCSPGYIKNANIKISELNKFCILDDKWSKKWGMWLKSYNIKQIPYSKRLRFSRDDLMIEAAKSGQGIAIALWCFVQDDIAQNCLINLFDSYVSTGKKYHIVCLKENARRPEIRSIINWLSIISKNSDDLQC